MLIIELFTTRTVEASSTEGMSRSGALLGKATQSQKRTQVENGAFHIFQVELYSWAFASEHLRPY